MKRFLQFAIFMAVTVTFLHGCLFKPDKVDPVENKGDYKELTSPENVLNNLIVSYQRREIEPYAKLLSRDYIFKFQPGDEPRDLDRGYWTFEEDSTGTNGLFSTPLVSKIEINLTYGAADTATEEEMPEGTMKIRVNPTNLTVDQTDGVTQVVDGDIQDMFFRRGTGADSTRWYLFEWRDIPGGGGVGAPGRREPQTLEDGRKVRHVTWGELLQEFARGRR